MLLSDILLKSRSLYFDIHVIVTVILVYVAYVSALCGFLRGRHLAICVRGVGCQYVRFTTSGEERLLLYSELPLTFVCMFSVWTLYLKERFVFCMPLYTVSPRKV